MKNKNSYRIAIGGIIAALSVVIMLLDNLVGIGTYALPALAGLLLTVIVIEFGKPWAFAVYAAVAMLSFVMVANKETVLIFTGFVGYYPILKAIIERVKKKLLQWVIKLAVFNVVTVGMLLLAALVLNVSLDMITMPGVNLPALMLLVGNVVFVLYDYTITLMVSVYVNRIRSKLFK